MIKQTDAITLFGENFDRTQALISAIDTIRAYNSIYQMKLEWPLEDRKMVKRIQDAEFDRIQQACGEHAIISKECYLFFDSLANPVATRPSSAVAAGNALAVAVQQIGVSLGKEEKLSILYHHKFVYSFDPTHHDFF